MMKRMALGKEINEGFDKLNETIAQQLRSIETGMPTIAALGFLPLNADELPPELLGG